MGTLGKPVQPVPSLNHLSVEGATFIPRMRHFTLLQKGAQVWFEFPAEIQVAGESLVEMLPKNTEKKYFDWGTHTRGVGVLGLILQYNGHILT